VISGQIILNDGDILTIAQQEFRLSYQNLGRTPTVSEATSIMTSSISEKLVRGTKQFRELMDNKQLTAHFQPIVTNEGLLGYEALARGTHETLSNSPFTLFTIAESIGLEVELSELCREQALAIADLTNKGVPYFFNIHPAEFRGAKRLMDSVAKLRNQYPNLELVFEVHEEAVTDITQMAELRDQLRAQGIKLAYDDFGAGQTRLMELTEVPADYVKFDIQLIRDIHKAPEARQQMVAMLIKFAQQAGSMALAEGVETEEEAIKCRELGFDLYQGYYFGRPQAHA
jgi:EAL domain-containing protein (putative c-di-GMP-specific phosphodiesterase class I)